MKTQPEKTKAEILKSLESKIEVAKTDLETARAAAGKFEQGIENRLRNDALGQGVYDGPDRREDSLTLARLAQECDFAERNLKVLGDALPEVRLAAVKETLGAIDASLRTFDQATLRAALQVFRGRWNGMVESLTAVESAYKERAGVEARFAETARGCPELAAARPVTALLPHSGFRNVFSKHAVIDVTHFSLNPERRFLPENAFEMQDRAAAPPANESEGV